MEAKVVLITSSRGGVGKTLISHILGKYISLNSRVCFLEMDIASPTIYYINKNFQTFIKEKRNEVSMYNPIVDVFNFVRERNCDYNILDERELFNTINSQYTFYDSCSFGIIGASPIRSEEAVDIIEEFTSLVTYPKKFDAVINCLRNKYDYIFIDTAAGIRDFAFYLHFASSIDLVLSFCLPNKASILSTFNNIEIIDKSKKRIIVLNQVKEIDKVLFGNIHNLIDYIIDIKHNLTNEQFVNYSLKTEADIKESLIKVNRLMTINWNEGLARFDDFINFNDLNSFPDDIKDLYNAINNELE